MANWNGVIVNAGNDLLNGWVAENIMNYAGAAAGTAKVADVALMAQTDVSGVRKPAAIIGVQKVDEGYRVKVRITSGDAAYPLFQIGVYANLRSMEDWEDGGKGEPGEVDSEPVLLALFQHQLGVPIPSKEENPDFAYTFSGLIMCSNTGEWTVTPSPSVMATMGDLDEAIATRQPKIEAQGLLKGNGDGAVVAATPGTDYGFPLLRAEGDPTEDTAAAVGQHYFDTLGGKEYVCKVVSEAGKYIWESAGAATAGDLVYGDQPLDEALDAMSRDIEGKASIDPKTGKIDPSVLPETGDYDPAGTAAGLVGQHDKAPAAHSDIRKTAGDALTAAQSAVRSASQAASDASAAQTAADAALKAVSDLVNRIDAVPSQGGSLAYNGSSQSPVWNSYDPETLEISGTTSAVNAGTYTVTFTPAEGYHWADGTTEGKDQSAGIHLRSPRSDQ